MLRTLLESNAPRQRRRGGTAASVAIHTAAVVAAIVATASAKPEGRPAVIQVDEGPFFVWPRDWSPTETSPTRRATGASRDHAPMPRLKRFIWTDAPDPGSARLNEIDPAALLRIDSVAPPGGVVRVAGASGGPGNENAPLTSATVDRIAALLSPPRPRYPQQLRVAGVTGRVVVRLIVDTLGRVEEGSVAVRESSHDLFTQTVLAALPMLRFAPAEANGRRVRMLVDLPFEFRLDR
jgi:protein TonB